MGSASLVVGKCKPVPPPVCPANHPRKGYVNLFRHPSEATGVQKANYSEVSIWPPKKPLPLGIPTGTTKPLHLHHRAAPRDGDSMGSWASEGRRACPPLCLTSTL